MVLLLQVRDAHQSLSDPAIAGCRPLKGSQVVGRLLRGTFKLTLIAGVAGGLVVAAKKLMGGLGPQPGDPAAPKEWPSLVPEPPAENGNGSNGNGSAVPGSASSSPSGSTSTTTSNTPWAHDADDTGDTGDALAAAVGGLADDAGDSTTVTDDVKLEPTDAETIPTTAPEALNEK